MLSKKGFSLLEVLISLMLISTLALVLLSYQLQSQLLLSQWLEHSVQLDLAQQHHEMQIIIQQAPGARS